MKKQLTATQKKKKYRAIQKASFAGEFVSIATPYIVMGAINFDEWFKVQDGWKIGLGGAMAMALLGLAVFIITKKKEDKDSKTGGYITLLLGWLAVAFVFVLLANILYQIATIMFFGAIGIAGALGLEIVSKNYEIKADMYEQAIKEAKLTVAKEDAYKQIQEEVEREKSKRVF